MIRAAQKPISRQPWLYATSPLEALGLVARPKKKVPLVPLVLSRAECRCSHRYLSGGAIARHRSVGHTTPRERAQLEEVVRTQLWTEHGRLTSLRHRTRERCPWKYEQPVLDSYMLSGNSLTNEERKWKDSQLASKPVEDKESQENICQDCNNCSEFAYEYMRKTFRYRIFRFRPFALQQKQTLLCVPSYL